MEDWNKYEPEFRYMMLSRMKQDCDYYLGNGNRSTNHLWAGNEVDQIANMKAIWDTFEPDDKPEWLTLDELIDYSRKMGVVIEDDPEWVMYFRKNRDDDVVQYTRKGANSMRPLLDILNAEKRLSEELDAIDQGIRSTVIIFDELYAMPDDDSAEALLQKYRDELTMLREKEKDVKTPLAEVRGEIRRYFEQLNK